MTEKGAKSAGPDQGQAAPRTASVRNQALDGLMEAGAPWWRRYSSHGEFPWSTTGSLVLHFLLIVLLLILARGFQSPDREPLGCQTVLVGPDPEAAEGDSGTDKAGGPEGEPTQEQKQDEPKPEQPTPEKTEREKVDEVKTEDLPTDMSVPTFDPSSLPTEDVPKKVVDRISQAKNRLEKALQKQPKTGTGGKGGSRTGPGGSGGSGASGKAARAARWVLISQGSDIHSHIIQLDGLGAAFAVPGRGDRFVYFHNAASSNRTSEERDLGGENRIYWTFEKPSMVREFCQMVGIPNADMLVMFLPVELEERMAEMERNYQGKGEEDVAQTRFRIVQRGGRYDVTVVGQTLK